MTETALLVPDFVTVTLGLVVYLAGAEITRAVRFLRDFNIPEPVSGGIAAALVITALHYGFGVSVDFEMDSRDALLVVFFTGIGLNARLSDLASGGRALGILLGLTLAMIVLQNVVGAVGAMLAGLPPQAGVLLGSAALIGGHGTAIAWGPVIEGEHGVTGAAEMGIAVATLGLVAASMIGGPIARFLIERRGLTPARPEEELSVGVAYEDEEADCGAITVKGLMRALLAINVSIMLGYAAAEAIAETGLKLPLFVPCLIVGIIVGNLLPVLAPRLPAISRTPALGLVSDYALGVFLSISLMSMKLWTLEGLGGPLLLTLGAQTAMTAAFVVFVLFPAMGGGYRGAVLGAGFGGFALGATPTAIANMTAVTKRYGPSPMAFVILPLVSAFFVDLANAFVIQTVLSLGSP